MYNIVHLFLREDDDNNKTQFAFNGQFQNYYTYHDDPDFGIDQSIIELQSPAGSSYQHTLYTINSTKLNGSAPIDNDPTRSQSKENNFG